MRRIYESSHLCKSFKRKQAESGTSIPAQIKICKEYLNRNGYILYKTYIDEAKSALSTDRPSFQEMIEEAKKNQPPFEAIVIYSFSRFARNRLDSITYKLLLRKKGIKVISVTEPLEEDAPEGKLLEGIIEVINEFYSSNLARETFRGRRKTPFKDSGTVVSLRLATMLLK